MEIELFKKLAACTVDEIVDLAENDADSLYPDIDEYSKAVGQFELHARVEKICQLILEKAQPKTLDDMKNVVNAWDSVCYYLIGGSVSLDTYNEEGAALLEYSEYMELTAVNCSYYYVQKEYLLASALASLVSQALNVEQTSYEQDKPLEFFTFSLPQA